MTDRYIRGILRAGAAALVAWIALMPSPSAAQDTIVADWQIGGRATDAHYASDGALYTFHLGGIEGWYFSSLILRRPGNGSYFERVAAKVPYQSQRFKISADGTVLLSNWWFEDDHFLASDIYGQQLYFEEAGDRVDVWRNRPYAAVYGYGPLHMLTAQASNLKELYEQRYNGTYDKLAFFRDGESFVLMDSGGNVALIETESGAVKRTFSTEATGVKAIDVDPMGKTLLAAASSKVFLIDLGSGMTTKLYDFFQVKAFWRRLGLASITFFCRRLRASSSRSLHQMAKSIPLGH